MYLKRPLFDYIAGYTTANDLSERKWQRDPAFAGGVPQWCFSKGFDKFCPMGPMIVSPKVIFFPTPRIIRTFQLI
jgi:2-keto-4-pentenoate hydratase/2-oxohepta-3-ene-1,7-dioic acid hydratase in catechol pathway